MGENQVTTRRAERLVVRLRGSYRVEGLDRLARDLVPLTTLDRPMRLELDLSGLAFVSPVALAVLASTLSTIFRREYVNEGSTYVVPKNRLVAMYLARMDFERFFTSRSVPEAFVRGPELGFTPCLWMAPEDKPDVLAQRLATALGHSLPIADEVAVGMTVALGEILQNVLDHAESPGGAFAVAGQTSKKRGEFELAIADAGRGILASLRDNPDHQGVSGHLDAIERALRFGVTGNPGPFNAGAGLTIVREAVRANGGLFVVRSGTAAVASGSAERTEATVTPLLGTAVTIRVRCDAPFEVELPA